MIVGIDLGTTNSLVAYFTEDGPKIIPNRLGKHLTPSVVSVDAAGTVYVGETAKERMSLYPESVAETFKRSMGTERTYQLSGHSFKPEELSSFVLRFLKEDAEAFLGEEVTEAVISVPAYFDDKRRKATKRAGELAGLKVERMISEPTAAAVAYGLYDKTQDTRFLVFDLGGGTFDVSILELYHNILEVRAVAGDNYLGGGDFAQEMAKLFLKKAGMQLSDLNEKEQVRLENAAERAKREINEQATVTMGFLYHEEVKEVQITAKEYEEACEELLGKIREPVKKSLADAKLKLSDIDEILLIGGATRLSIVRDFLIRLFRKFPDTKLNPDETVALGAAVQAAMKERREEVKEVILTDVCSFTLGTEVVVEYDEGKFEDGRFCPIIERNTVIPASRTERLYTVRDNQTSVRVRVLQGESRFARNNLYLGELEIEVPKGLKGQESVDVTYTYDINSLLEVEVKVVSTGISKKMIIKGDVNHMTEEEIAKRMEELAYLKIQPRDYEENRLVLLRAERMYEESLGERRQKLDHYITKFEAALKKEDHDEIQTTREELNTFLSESDDLETR
ncbi:MAG: molecular chaperone HscC [Lachnospiraceae bacterium]|nr:molecular chaperone HscC [Lachnospiraceae bacterium]